MTQGFSRLSSKKSLLNDEQPSLFSAAPLVTGEVVTQVSSALTTERADVRSLSMLLEMVEHKIKTSFVTEFWVKAEVVESKATPAGHVYLELVERGEDASKPKAKARANIWKSNATQLISKFKRATGSDIRPGISILVKVRIAFSSTFGFALVVSDIDPTFTVGAMAAHIAEIKRKLMEGGILKNNRQLTVPNDFFHIAVVAPESAAGLGDFKREADILHDFGVTKFEYFYAVFQGDKASSTISSAIDRAGKTGPDVIVVLRGGGGTSDLQYLNDYNIARAICLAPVPVIVGIGHEKDKTLLDEIAAVSCGTPSKVIGYIASALKAKRERGVDAMARIRQSAMSSVTLKRERSQRFMSAIQGGATLITSKARARSGEIMRTSSTQALRVVAQKRTESTAHIGNICTLASRIVAQKRSDSHLHMDSVVKGARRAVEDKRNVSQMLFREINGQGPEKTLSRGFALTRNSDGKIITSAAMAANQNQLTVQYADGQINVELLK